MICPHYETMDMEVSKSNKEKECIIDLSLEKSYIGTQVV